MRLSHPCLRTIPPQTSRKSTLGRAISPHHTQCRSTSYNHHPDVLPSAMTDAPSTLRSGRSRSRTPRVPSARSRSASRGQDGNPGRPRGRPAGRRSAARARPSGRRGGSRAPNDASDEAGDPPVLLPRQSRSPSPRWDRRQGGGPDRPADALSQRWRKSKRRPIRPPSRRKPQRWWPDQASRAREGLGDARIVGGRGRDAEAQGHAHAKF